MPVCELCGKSDFVKQEGMFVCQGCGTKYTLEEAKKLMADEGGAPVPVVAAQVAQPVQIPVSNQAPADQSQSAPGGLLGEVAAIALAALAEVVQASAAPPIQDVRSLNNAIATGWQSIVDGYKKLEHPTKADLDKVVDQAKQCLVAFDNAAMIEPDKYVQNTLMYENCIEIASSAERLDCYELVEGEWKRMPFPVRSSDLKIPGQKDSWDSKRDAHAVHIREEYTGSHPEEVAQRQELCAQEASIQAELDELKDEKKSKGFFNFSEKREVKERMAPVKERLADVQKQIRALDRNIEAYVEERLDELAKSFVRLDF
ncbi:MAG: hypothetical protein IJ131_02045 [Eggerthellaceae bacterium]|nr:hypothetical protein [Eggerthellaceae bacterium]